MEVTGPLNINLIDNLILVHHQTQKVLSFPFYDTVIFVLKKQVTFVFDIAIRCKQSKMKTSIHKPIIQPAQSIAPLSLASNSEFVDKICVWPLADLTK